MPSLFTLKVLFCTLCVSLLTVAAPTTLPTDPPPIAPQKTAGDLEQAIHYVDELEKLVDGSSTYESVRHQARDMVTGLRARIAVAKGDIAGARRWITQIRGPTEKRNTGVNLCREVSRRNLETALQIAPYLVGLRDRPDVLEQIAGQADSEGDLDRYRQAVAALPPLGPSRPYHVEQLLEMQAQFADLDSARATIAKYRIPDGEQRLARIDAAFNALTDLTNLRAETATGDEERLKELTYQLMRWRPALAKRLDHGRLLELADASPRRAGYQLLWAAFNKAMDTKRTDDAVEVAKTMEDWASREQRDRGRLAAYDAAGEMWQKLSRPDDAWRCVDQANGTTPDARPVEKLTRSRETVVMLLLSEKRDADARTILARPIDRDDIAAWADQLSLHRSLVRSGKHDLLWDAAATPDAWMNFVNHARVAETMLRFDADRLQQD